MADKQLKNHKVARPSGSFAISSTSNARRDTTAIQLGERQKYMLINLEMPEIEDSSMRKWSL